MTDPRVSAWDELTAAEAEAADALFGMIAGPSGYVQLDWHEDTAWRSMWIPCDDLARWRHHSSWFAERYDVRIGAAPRSTRERDTPMRCSVLWVVAESRRACERLGRLRPRPTLVLREGGTTRTTAIWALDKPLAWDWTIRGNRRIAHYIDAPKKYAEPTHGFRIPGSAVRWGRDGPRLIPLRINVVEFEPAAIYEARRVVGHLADAPDPNAWRDKKAS